MASRILLLPLTRPRTISVGLGITSIFAAQSLLTLRQPPIRCDAVATAGDFVRGYSREAQNPIVTRDGKVNRNVIRQLSAGSITGLIGGLAVSVFSKPLALLIGLLVIGAQVLESKGIHIIPYGRLQNIFRNTNIKDALQDNIAFKATFGLTFALAAFAEF